VKKAIIHLIPILIIIIAIGCSSDHEAPTFSKFEVAKKPFDVVASYDIETDKVNVTWDIAETTSIVDYFISVSDSSDFDLGKVWTGSSNSLDKSYLFNVKNYLSPGDSEILYFTVSAVYKNENLNYFIGPRADLPDSASIKRD